MTTDPLRWRDNPGTLPELREALTSIQQPVDLPDATFERVEVALAALGLPVLGAVSGIVTTVQTSAITGSPGAAVTAASTTAVAPGTAASVPLTAPLAASSGTVGTAATGAAGTAATGAAGTGVSAIAGTAASGTAGAIASTAHGILGASVVAKLAVVSAVAVGGPALWVASNSGGRFSVPARQQSSVVSDPPPSSGTRTVAGPRLAAPSSSPETARPKPVATIDLESWDTSLDPHRTFSADRQGDHPAAAGGSPERGAATKRAGAASGADLTAEARLLESVRAAVVTSSATARILLKRYDARFPHGQLKQEAEVLRVRLKTADGNGHREVP